MVIHHHSLFQLGLLLQDILRIEDANSLRSDAPSYGFDATSWQFHGLVFKGRFSLFSCFPGVLLRKEKYSLEKE